MMSRVRIPRQEMAGIKISSPFARHSPYPIQDDEGPPSITPRKYFFYGAHRKQKSLD